MAEVIDAVSDAGKPQVIKAVGHTGGNEDLSVLMLNEESFIGVADFEQEVVKDGFNNQNEETLFDDDIMHSLLQLNND